MRIGVFKASFARGLGERMGKDPRLTARIVLGGLLAGNLLVAGTLFGPWAASPEALQRQLAELRRQEKQQQATVARLSTVLQTVEKTRAQGDQFLQTYFLDGATAYSTVLAELHTLAEQSGIKARDHSFAPAPIEGSDTLGMMTITGNYEGTYANLLKFVNAIDRSPRFLTIERLQAAPLQAQGDLNINMRLNVFIRMGAGTP